MPMCERGLVKLIEECGELTQVAAKLIAYPEGVHPDNGPPLRERLEDEMADVLAAVHFVGARLGLRIERVDERMERKMDQYMAWDRESNS